jgi:hypothetical protein
MSETVTSTGLKAYLTRFDPYPLSTFKSDNVL